MGRFVVMSAPAQEPPGASTEGTLAWRRRCMLRRDPSHRAPGLNQAIRFRCARTGAALTQPENSLRFGRASCGSTPRGMHVRDSITLLLAVILLACPAVCRGTEVACCPGFAADECSEEPEPDAPAAPAEAASCICSGAVVRTDDSHATRVAPYPPSFLPGSPEPSLRMFLRTHSRRGLPAGRDDWQRIVRIDALREVIRC
jgi:hypothetical protein